jgi:hypothetical protein
LIVLEVLILLLCGLDEVVLLNCRAVHLEVRYDVAAVVGVLLDLLDLAKTDSDIIKYAEL